MEKVYKVQDQIDNQLLKDRKIFLWGMVDDDSAKHVVDRLLYLDSLNHEEIQLYINSPGGVCDFRVLHVRYHKVHKKPCIHYMYWFSSFHGKHSFVGR